jgi:cyclic-di-GMP-binding protein
MFRKRPTGGVHMGRCPSGQRKQIVTLPAYAFVGSNPTRPTTTVREPASDTLTGSCTFRLRFVRFGLGSSTATVAGMGSFDVVSEVDEQEVKNAVDQAQREIANRFDFKNTNSSIDLKDLVITLHTASADRLDALRIVVEEKLVKRSVSLRGVEYGDVQEASQNTVRQVMTIAVGISSEKSKLINRTIKEKGPKGVTSQVQGDSIRVNGKKRDDLQAVIAILKTEDVGIPLQFQNFRD